MNNSNNSIVIILLSLSLITKLASRDYLYQDIENIYFLCWSNTTIIIKKNFLSIFTENLPSSTTPWSNILNYRFLTQIVKAIDILVNEII